MLLNRKIVRERKQLYLQTRTAIKEAGDSVKHTNNFQPKFPFKRNPISKKTSTKRIILVKGKIKDPGKRENQIKWVKPKTQISKMPKEPTLQKKGNPN